MGEKKWLGKLEEKESYIAGMRFIDDVLLCTYDCGQSWLGKVVAEFPFSYSGGLTVTQSEVIECINEDTTTYTAVYCGTKV